MEGVQHTQDTTLLDLIQDTLGVNTSLEILLSNLTELEILECYFPHELEIILEPFDSSLPVIEIIVELHARLTHFLAGTHSETAHTTAVQVQGANGEEI